MEQLIQQLHTTLLALLSLPSWLQALLQPTIQQVQAQLASLLAGGASGGPPPPPGSGTLPTATPELDSVLLFGAGALGLAAVAWWQRRRHGAA
jgi:hypothetical protein